jgi:amidase
VAQLTYCSVAELAERIGAGELSSEELVAACIERINEVNPRLNAVVHLVEEEAMAAAREADLAFARGETRGPLHGVPMCIKDSFDTAGVISTAGTTGRAGYIPKQDATVVARLKAAGAILLGKTNTSELTLSFEPFNLLFGKTYNPYDLTKSPGGSSGGAAAIVAAGGAPFDIGSDYAGSIRLPAHFSGVAGIKPTSGRVPRTGHIIPYAAGAPDGYQQVGPLARTVEDLALLLELIAGPDWEDPTIVPMPLLSFREVELGTLRVSYYTDNGTLPPIPEISGVVTAVADALENHVAIVEENRPPRLDETWKLWSYLDSADGFGGGLEILENAGTKETNPYIQSRRLAKDEQISAEEFGRRLREVERFRSQMLGFMREYDLLVCPANANVALPYDSYEQFGEGFSYTATYNITGWPAAVVRAGTSKEGLPIGVQLVGQPWREDVVLAAAHYVETTFGGWQPPSL